MLVAFVVGMPTAGSVTAGDPIQGVLAEDPSDLRCREVSTLVGPGESPTASGTCEGIRPGAWMTAPAHCTFGFILEDDTGALYVTTAGHCVSAIGQRVTASGIGAFGSVVYFIDEGEGADFAVIKIDEWAYAHVDPEMCGWGGPTAEDPDDASVGDEVLQFGHGVVLGETDLTRPRGGVLTNWEDDVWRAVLPGTPGDSGSAVVFASGEAVGILTHLVVMVGIEGTTVTPPVHITGTRLSHGIGLAEAATGTGFSLATSAVTPQGIIGPSLPTELGTLA